jgi:large subunit ribosomal protein L19
MSDRVQLGIQAGDTVRVHQKIKDEKGKTRLQIFEGLVLARKHGDEPGATFTVRKVVDGIGVEKIFPLYTPMVDKIEIVKRSTVRRAKLYYIREKVAREIKRQMRRMRLMTVASESEIEAAARAEANAKAAEAARQAEETKNAEEAARQAEEVAKAHAEAAPAQVETTEVASGEEKKGEVKVS